MMTAPFTTAPVCGRLAAPDRHPPIRPVYSTLLRIGGRRPASAMRTQTAPPAAGAVI
jgi:hypothetical protein